MIDSIDPASIGTFPAATILERFDPNPLTIEKSASCDHAIDLLDSLVNASDYIASIDFLSHWMSPQCAVWWGCLCVWETERERSSPELDAAMQLILGWLHNPTEQSRQRLAEIAALFEKKHPVCLIGNAALYSSGSMSAPDWPPVAPPRFLYANLVAGAIKLIVSRGDMQQYDSRNKQVLRLGMEVLQGVNRWQSDSR